MTPLIEQACAFDQILEDLKDNDNGLQFKLCCSFCIMKISIFNDVMEGGKHINLNVTI